MKLELRPCTDHDYAFCWQAKKSAMGPHIESHWGWDETFQESVHRQRWQERPWSLILLDGMPIGTLSIYDRTSVSVRFGEFYLLPEWQRQGIGSRVLADFLASCDADGLTVELEYLKWNPVGSLYRRHGFTTCGETEHHYHLRREPDAA